MCWIRLQQTYCGSVMAYQLVTVPVTFSDLEGPSHHILQAFLNVIFIQLYSS